MEEDIIVTYSGNEEQFNITKELEDKYKADKLSLSADQLRFLLDFKNMALQNLIARYKELEENLNYRVRYCNILEKELYGENSVELTKLEDKYFIPKSKVQEKIEELEKDKENEKEDEWLHCSSVNNLKISVLQELLED